MKPVVVWFSLLVSFFLLIGTAIIATDSDQQIKELRKQNTELTLARQTDNEREGAQLKELADKYNRLVDAHEAVLAENAELKAFTQEELEMQYYRGIFDFCIWAMKDVRGCNRTIGILVGKNWFEQPSPGFVWPPAVVPAPEPEPNRVTPSGSGRSNA